MTNREHIAQMFWSEIRSDIAKIRGNVGSVRPVVISLSVEVESDFLTFEKRLKERVARLNRAAVEYHSSTLGHGALLSEIDERLRRVEQHLKLPPHRAH
jgi:hypothetical protein